MRQLIIHGYNWTIKRSGERALISNYLDLLFEIADRNGDTVTFNDKSDTDLIIINYERGCKNGK